MTSESDPNAPSAPPVKRKASAVVLPPSDPARKDWGILSDSLGLEKKVVPPAGCSPEEGAQLMTELLLKIVQDSKAYEALIMKCAGETIAGKMRDDVAGRISFDDMLSFLKSRLWNRRSDGTRTQSRMGRQYSSNDVIQGWEPEAGGIAKYIQVHVSNILNRDWKQVAMQLSNPYKVSVEVLAAKNRHIANNGQIFDNTQKRGGDDSDAPDYIEDPEALDRATERGSIGRGPNSASDEALEEELTELPEPALDADGEEPVTAQRSLFDTVRLPSAGTRRNSLILKTTENPDFQLLAAAGVTEAKEPALDLEERIIQLRALANKAITLHYDESPELHDVLEAAETWDPTEYSFANYFPEVCDEIAKSLDGVGPKNVQKAELELIYAVDFVMLSDELKCQSKRLSPRPAGWSADEWAEISENIDTWFSAQSSDHTDLASTERPDYLALCALTGRRPQDDLAPAELGKALKAMFHEWHAKSLSSARRFGSRSLQILSDNYAAISEMNKRMEDWDPLQHGYAGECMITHLHAIRIEQKKLEEDRRAQEAEARAQECTRVENMHRVRHARPVSIPSAVTLSLFDEATLVSHAPPPELPTPKTNQEPSL